MISRIAAFVSTFLICFVALGQNIIEIKESKIDHYTRFEPFDSFLDSETGTIVDIFQDSIGYIWLAGTNGLNRFNGNTVKKYVEDWTPGSLPSSFVTSFTQDVYGRLWVGTKKGLCTYNYEADNFETVFGGDSLNNPTDSLYIRAILADGDSLLWIETQQGLLWKVDLKSLEVLTTFSHTQSGQAYYHYHALYRDPNGKLWLGGRGIGPWYLDEEKGKVVLLPTTQKVYLPGRKRETDVSYFFKDSESNFWMGSLEGIFTYDISSGYFHRFLKSSSWTMLESSSGDLWFGTASGLAKYNLGNEEMVFYSHNEEDPSSLPSDNIYKIIEDKHRQIWAATEKGVAVLKHGQEGVTHLFHIPGLDQTLASSTVTDLVEDPNGKIWIATEQKGIDRLDPKNLAIEHFNSENTKGLVTDKIRCLALSNNSSIYCGLWAGLGFGILNPDEGDFELFTFQKENRNRDWYNDLVFDNSGNLYLGFWGGNGLTFFDTIQKQFGRGLKNKFQMTFVARLITCLEIDFENNLWMGTTSGGLHLYLPEKDTSVCYYSKVNPEEGIDQAKIVDIAEGPDKTIWVGAQGLFFKKATEKSFTQAKLSNTKTEPEVFAILPENDSVIWLLTSEGLLCYCPKISQTENYSPWVNLEFNENAASIIKTKEGKLAIGGEGGLVLVDPSKLSKEIHKPEIYVSSLSVFETPKIHSFESLEKVSLKHNENFFSVQFGSDTWGDDDLFKYFYLLEGFNKEWVEISKTEKLATFTNVPSGTYNFLLKVDDLQGETVINKALFELKIIPPFYVRWWFILSTIFIFFVAVAYFWNYRMKKVRAQVLNAELKQKLLRLQMNPHFIFNSLSAIQSYIYSNQTHLAGNYLSDFARLIRLILDNSRHEFIGIDKETEYIELYLKLQKLRFDNKFRYNLSIDPALLSGDYQIPPMLAQPFLENAIEHGLKNINYPGELDVSYQLVNKTISFSVIDNGIGLTASKKRNERRNSKHKSLAISICKNRLEALKSNTSSPICLNIEELIGDKGNVLGTKVAFAIPFNLN